MQRTEVELGTAVVVIWHGFCKEPPLWGSWKLFFRGSEVLQRWVSQRWGIAKVVFAAAKYWESRFGICEAIQMHIFGYVIPMHYLEKQQQCESTANSTFARRCATTKRPQASKALHKKWSSRSNGNALLWRFTGKAMTTTKWSNNWNANIPNKPIRNEVKHQKRKTESKIKRWS